MDEQVFVYKEYWLMQPHCPQAVKKKLVGGKFTWYCRHYLQNNLGVESHA